MVSREVMIPYNADLMHWQRITEQPNWKIFKDLKKVLFHGKHPDDIFTVRLRHTLRLVYLWPRNWSTERPFYYVTNVVIMTALTIFAISITAALSEVTNDIVKFGDVLVILIGFYLIQFKIWVNRFKCAEIDAIASEMNGLHHRFSTVHADNDKILGLQRLFYLFENLSFIIFSVIATSLTLSIVAQPFFTDTPLPFNAKFPFGWHDPDRNFYSYSVIYVFQCAMLVYHLWAIVTLDGVGCHTMSQTALNLKLLCVRIRNLKKGHTCTDLWSGLRDIVQTHQQLIALVEKINNCYYLTYVIQMLSSTMIICLTAFESTLVKDELVVAIKFEMYMFAGFGHLFYFCFLGNMVYYESVEVATAAFEIHKWYEESPQLMRNLMILIKRAQKPLIFRPRPLFGFTFESFTSILSTSYSYFALLRTMSD